MVNVVCVSYLCCLKRVSNAVTVSSGLSAVMVDSLYGGGVGVGAGSSESPMNSKRTVGRSSWGMSIPRIWKLESSILKPH